MAERAELVDTVWTALYERLGEDLRVVTRYEGAAFETRMRPDVREQYGETEDRAIVDDLIVDQLTRAETERAFRAGELQAVVRMFEDAWVVSWHDDLPSKSGVVVSVQRGGGTDTASSLGVAVDYLETELPDVVG